MIYYYRCDKSIKYSRSSPRRIHAWGKSHDKNERLDILQHSFVNTYMEEVDTIIPIEEKMYKEFEKFRML